jgi:hypothetical protein
MQEDRKAIEARAAELVVAELGALRASRRDIPGAPDRTHDFDVIFRDQHAEPLEVTRHLDDIVMKSLRRSSFGRFSIDANVQHLWRVTGHQTTRDRDHSGQPFDRRRVEALLTPLIEQLDREGHESFEIADLSWPPTDVETTSIEDRALELEALGISQGRIVASSTRRCIDVHLSEGGYFGPEMLTATVEAIATLPDNVSKLERSIHRGRRHLFIRLFPRGATNQVFFALRDVLDGTGITDEDAPIPHLPPAITTVWVALDDRGIYSTPPEGWRRFGTVDSPILHETG